MRHRSRLLEVLYRAETGPIIEQANFERKHVAPAVKRCVQSYGIQYDQSVIVPSDDDLADPVFQAGMELAVEIGLFCQSTSRRILWTRADSKKVFDIVFQKSRWGWEMML